MKPAQWTGAVFALAAMVFVITFAMNYLGGRDNNSVQPTGPTARLNSLTFSAEEFPAQPQATPLPVATKRLNCEVKKPEEHDFWFVNENAEPVAVGLKSKSCRCSHAELYVVPEGRWP